MNTSENRRHIGWWLRGGVHPSVRPSGHPSNRKRASDPTNRARGRFEQGVDRAVHPVHPSQRRGGHKNRKTAEGCPPCPPLHGGYAVGGELAVTLAATTASTAGIDTPTGYRRACAYRGKWGGHRCEVFV